MKKILLAVLLMVPLFLSSQNTAIKYWVKGQAIDSVTQEAMPYATCTIVQEKNPQQVLTRFAADVNGNFSGGLKCQEVLNLIEKNY